MGIPDVQISPPRSPSPPGLTPGTSPDSSQASSRSSSRSASPLPFTPGAASNVNKLILCPKFSTFHESAVGNRELQIDQGCCLLSEGPAFYQSAQPVSLNALPGQQLGSEVWDKGVHFTSRDKKACHSKVFRMETNEGEKSSQKTIKRCNLRRRESAIGVAKTYRPEDERVREGRPGSR